jgi:hypothetical protein
MTIYIHDNEEKLTVIDITVDDSVNGWVGDLVNESSSCMRDCLKMTIKQGIELHEEIRNIEILHL